MVIERERTIRDLTERLEEANACHDRSIASLDAVSARLEDLQAQARGQATRIRMKALREAVELSGKAQALAEAEDTAVEVEEPRRRAEPAEPEIAAEVAAVEEAAAEAAPTANGSANGTGRQRQRRRGRRQRHASGNEPAAPPGSRASTPARSASRSARWATSPSWSGSRTR